MSHQVTPLRGLGEAVRFLTVLPWPRLSESADLSRAAAWFPVVGLLVGACAAVVGLGSEWLFGSPLHVVAAVTAATVVTGGLHLDGLADSADALGSWRSREAKLAIMRDSRIGTMGALALVLVLAVKLAALLALGPCWWRGALLAPLWGRCAAVYALVAFPSARDEGVGALARAQMRTGSLGAATFLAFVIGGLLSPPAGALVGLLVLVVAHGIARAMARSLGGLTGDSYGALSEIAELSTLLSLLALRQHGWIP